MTALDKLEQIKNGYTEVTNYPIQFNPTCSASTEPSCNALPYCKWENEACISDTSMTQVENNEDENEKLNKILLTRKRMLAVNLHKNDIKNKRIYTMFVFIILIILVMTIVHFKFSK
tara:strand:+ start:567 stop:917 length:351 start_codon:yes stop_codon:yes gene_type:complete